MSDFKTDLFSLAVKVDATSINYGTQGANFKKLLENIEGESRDDELYKARLKGQIEGLAFAFDLLKKIGEDITDLRKKYPLDNEDELPNLQSLMGGKENITVDLL